MILFFELSLFLIILNWNSTFTFYIICITFVSSFVWFSYIKIKITFKKKLTSWLNSEMHIISRFIWIEISVASFWAFFEFIKKFALEYFLFNITIANFIMMINNYIVISTCCITSKISICFLFDFCLIANLLISFFYMRSK